MTPVKSRSLLVVGRGPAGLCAALALARSGASVTIAGPAHRPTYQSGGPAMDRRTAALFGGSVELLRNLEVWDRLVKVSEPLTSIRIIDDTDGWLKAPEVTFKATDAGVDAFGFNVPNAALIEALEAAAGGKSPAITSVETAGITSLDCGPTSVTATTAEGRQITADLVVAADGRSSICRKAANIGTREWSYPQTAIVCSFEHSRPHRTISTEFHRAAGPFTVVPMPGRASSLVWVETPDEAQRLMSLSDAAMSQAIEERLHGLLGSVFAITPRAAFPLMGLSATTFAQNRVALVGEAGHVIPPIGAQGLNLGLRDAAALADCVASALQTGADPGSNDTLVAYTSARKADVTSRVWTIDILNRSLISPFLPVQALRGAGIAALRAIGPLRRLVVREGVQPSLATPTLMRPSAAQATSAP